MFSFFAGEKPMPTSIFNTLKMIYTAPISHFPSLVTLSKKEQIDFQCS